MLDALARPWSPVETSIDLPAPPHAVFEVLSDPRTYPDWLVGAKRIRHVDPAFPAPNAEFGHTVGAGPVTVDDTTEAVDAKPPYRLELEVHAGPINGTVVFVLSASADGTLLTFRERPTGPAGALTPLVRPTILARNKKSLENLRDYIAAHVPAR
jgi:uncharacterized protein YndB with AHSA1/START domain